VPRGILIVLKKVKYVATSWTAPGVNTVSKSQMSIHLRGTNREREYEESKQGEASWSKSTDLLLK
jgi:hypothetical protein